MKRNKLVYLITAFILAAAFLIPGTSSAMPKPAREVLDNGMVIILLEQHNLPMVDINVNFKAGSIYDPPDNAGLAAFTNTLLTRGTKSRNALQISQQIDFIGARLLTESSWDFAQVDLKVLKKDIPVGLDILMDVITNPTFTPEEVERERKETLAKIISEKDEPQKVASEEFYKLVFGVHSYNHPTEGTEQSIPLIPRERVLEFYQKYYRPNNVVLVAVGDITMAELKGLLGKYMTDWKPQSVQFPNIPQAPAPAGAPLKKLINKPLTQATIMLGHLGISRKNPDYYAAYVMNYILGGGGFASRLVKHIRDDMGLAYSAASFYYANIDPGSFQVVVETKNESTPQVVQAILEEIKNIQAQPVTDQELQEAKDYITGSFPLKLDTNTKIAAYLAYMEDFNLGMDYIEKFPNYINAVNKQQVQEAARKYLHPESYILVIVGDQSKIGLQK